MPTSSELKRLALEVRDQLTSFGYVNARSAWLSSDITADAASAQLTDVSPNAGEGVVEIDDELIYVRAYDSAAKTLLFAPDGRGYSSTTATSHAESTRVTFDQPYPLVSLKRAVVSAIERTYPTVWAVSDTTLTVDASKTTYELPAEAERVLAISTETWGASGEWPEIRRWRFDGAADTTAYPSGKTVTLRDGIPGRKIRVIFAMRPSVDIDGASDDWSSTGLGPALRQAVKGAAVAEALRYFEAGRASTQSPTADALDSKRPYLTATKIAADLEQQFQNELSIEARRLRQLYPQKIVRKV